MFHELFMMLRGKKSRLCERAKKKTNTYATEAFNIKRKFDSTERQLNLICVFNKVRVF